MTEEFDLEAFQREVDKELLRLEATKGGLGEERSLLSSLLASGNEKLLRPKFPQVMARRVSGLGEQYRKHQDEQLLRALLEMEPGKQDVRGSETSPPMKPPSVEVQRMSLIAQPSREHRSTRSMLSEELTTEQQAREILERRDIRALLCPALETGSGDAFAIANTLTQVLGPLVLAGALSVPLIPVLFASMAFLLSRMGIATWCVDYRKKNENKK